MSRITKQLKFFSPTITPNIYEDNALTRLEHFEVSDGKLVPFRTLGASTLVNSNWSILSSFLKVTGTTGANGISLFALAQETVAPRGTILYWDKDNYRWDTYQSINADGQYATFLHYYQGYFYGLWKGTNMWQIKAEALGSRTVNGTFAAITYTNYSNPITHSKDGLMYFAADNLIKSFNGTTLSTGLTLPSNFIITSIAEDGDYIMIVGYDSGTGKATAYKWDRDSSLATLTAKYDLGYEVPVHNATIGGTHFIISKKTDTDSTAFVENPQLIIRYITGDKAKILKTFTYSYLTVGGKYLANDGLYFTAYIYQTYESAGHFVVFKLDENGNLTMPVNAGIDTGTAAITGIIRDGDGFFLGSADGQWSSHANTYTTTSFFETTKDVAKNLTNNLDLVGAVVTFDPLPASSSVVVKTRKENETSWTTLATFNTEDSVKGIALGTGDTAKERQFRVESTGGAVITGFQRDYDEKPNEAYS